MRLVQARLVTTDVSSLARFYEELLGVISIGSEDYVEMRNSGGAVAISSKRSIDIFSAGAAEPGANRSVILDFQVNDVDKERLRLQDLVRDFVLEPTNQPWGSRSMLFRDPDGNLINFFSVVTRGAAPGNPGNGSAAKHPEKLL